jgi:hypothetical protein
MDTKASSCILSSLGYGCRHAAVLLLALLGAGSCTAEIVDPGGEKPTITTATLSDGAVGVAYAAELSASGGQDPYSWAITAGSVPAGLVLISSGGVISGTPTVPGTSEFTVRVTGEDGLSSTRSLSLSIGPEPLRILFSSLPDAVIGIDYRVHLQASGGDGRYSWSMVSGSLPDGLSLNEGVVSGRTTASGYFPIGLQVESDGRTVAVEDRVRVYPTQNLRIFLEQLPSWIASSLQYNQDLLPRNPHLASEIEAKIALLSTPGLEASILNETLFEEREVTTLDGRTIPAAVVFPADSMRSGARLDLERLPPTIAALEHFIGVQWPRNYVYEWYGFRMGNSGGGGRLYMEDRGTYADRGVLYDAILSHEVGHSYTGHEGLTQFLEVYSYNVVETGSTNLRRWPWKRTVGDAPYVPFAPVNEGAWALMDIYQLIGPDSMGRAFARIHAMGVPYGTPLSDAARQTFIDEAPPAVRSQVVDLVPRI